jgi:mitochondrial fission protein ELM1
MDRRALAMTDARRNGGRAPATRILILSDGVAGHDRSSLGILAALAKHRPIDARLLPIRETRRLSRRLKRVLAAALPFDRFWKSFYRVGGEASAFNPLPLTMTIGADPVDLVISTGPRTSAANIALARRLKAKNVYFGRSRWPSDGFYTVLLTPERRRPHPHRAYALRPSELDATQLPEARPLAANGTQREASLLFGGQSKHYSYTLADMEMLAARIIALSRDLPWLKWTLLDSRRSPKAEFDRLVALVEASGAPVAFVRFTEEGLLSNALAFRSDLVLVTADSMSMLAESVAACRPTGILLADRYRPPQRDATEQAAMVADRRAFTVEFSNLSADAVLRGAEGLELLAGSQLDVLHATLVRHGI